MIHYYFFLYGPIFGQEMPGFTANMGGYPNSWMVYNPDAPWCWNIYLHLPQKSPSYVGKYTIHGASGKEWFNLFHDPLLLLFIWSHLWSRNARIHGKYGGGGYPNSWMVYNPDAPWCWNIYLHLPQKSPSYVGKYTIHGASGKEWFNLFHDPLSLIKKDLNIYIYIQKCNRHWPTMVSDKPQVFRIKWWLSMTIHESYPPKI